MKKIIIIFILISTSIFAQSSILMGYGVDYTLDNVIKFETVCLKNNDSFGYGLKAGIGFGNKKSVEFIDGENYNIKEGYASFSISSVFYIDKFFLISIGLANIYNKVDSDLLSKLNNEINTSSYIKTSAYINLGITPLEHSGFLFGISYLTELSDGKGFGFNIAYLF